MTWLQKFRAIEALAGHQISLRLTDRAFGDHWYVADEGVEIVQGGMLSSAPSFAETPEAAVEAYWDNVTENLKPREYVVIHAYGKDRRALRWNDFMWESVRE